MLIIPIRHATCLIHYGGKKILLDPVFSPAGTMAAIPDVPNTANNPLVELPIAIEAIIKDIDAIIITHTHRDHFDSAAMQVLPKTIPLFCQPTDLIKITEAGFRDIRPVKDNIHWNSMTIYRTDGRHGKGIVGMKMGTVSGFVFSAPNEPKLYITGDTIWCNPVKQTLRMHQPQIILAYTGSAKFKHGKPITMGEPDILNMVKVIPKARIIAIHLEAWNHCRLSRDTLRQSMRQNSLCQNVYVPENGEQICI